MGAPLRSWQLAALRKAVGLLNAVPLPHDGTGTKSASTHGMVTFARDARKARELFGFVWEAIWCGDDAGTVNEKLANLNEWFDERRKADWR